MLLMSFAMESLKIRRCAILCPAKMVSLSMKSRHETNRTGYDINPKLMGRVARVFKRGEVDDHVCMKKLPRAESHSARGFFIRLHLSRAIRCIDARRNRRIA